MGARSGRAKSPDPGRRDTNSHSYFEEDHFGQSLSCKLKESPRAPLLGGVELREVALELREGFIFKGEDKRGNIRKKGEKDPAHRGNRQFLHLHL